jgi:peptide/nickel transport system permease protein
MGTYIVKRILIAVPTLVLIAFFGYVIMELPPGDFVNLYARVQAVQGADMSLEAQETMREELGLNLPLPGRFIAWLGRFAQGDFGNSFQYRTPVRDIILERLGATVLVSLCVFVVSWGIGIPLGVYSATHQYSKADNLLTTLAFIGLGIPDFLIALVLLMLTWQLTGEVLTGLQSTQYISVSWTLPALLDLLKHLWLPVIAVAVTGIAWVMRVMRGNLLDEMGKNYVTTLRAKGVPERIVIWKHAFRNALHPLVASLGQTLAFLVNGFAITSVVLNVPTLQSVYLEATFQQDVPLSSTILVLIGFLILLGTLIADILLAWLDPRIRYS